jgi:choline dehydrogenase-like flavoprotein
MWEAEQPMVTSSTQWWEIGIFADTEPGLDRPDLMFHYGSVPFDMNTYRRGYPTTDNAFCLTPNVTRARSMGTVRLRTRDFRDKPKVDPRYFTHEHDIRVMVHGLRLARKITAGAPMAGWTGAELAPGPAAQSDDELFSYIRETHNTVYHPAGTVRMGAAEDTDSPLDPQLRVKGVRGLRVADASIMPFLPSVNPCITTMMIGEKCADMIKSTWATSR